jgi:TM2 domain-containing membrane protein YozV
MQPPPGHDPYNQFQQGPPMDPQKKILCGILGIVCGALGIHKFVLGYNTAGIIMVCVTLIAGFFTCGMSSAAMGIIGLIEGIIYLTKSDQEFHHMYVVNKKEWF